MSNNESKGQQFFFFFFDVAPQTLVCEFQVPNVQPVSLSGAGEVEHYEVCRVCVEELALYLKPISGAKGSVYVCA